MPPRTFLGALAAPAVLALASAIPLTLVAPASALPVPAGASPAAARPAPPTPNLVFVMADDLGWSDLSTGRTNGGHGNDFNETPVIDRLAAEGQVFTDAYASLQCAPTRMALHTGQYAVRPTNNVYAVGAVNRPTTTPLVGVTQGRAEDGKVAIPTDYTTVAETLQRAGYTTGYTGKFHVTGTAEEIVDSHGFDESWGGGPNSHATEYHAHDGRFNDTVTPALDAFAADYTEEYVAQHIAPYSQGVSEAQLDALVGTPKHVTDAVTDATIGFIDRNKDQPFFAFVSEFAPHFPVDDEQARTDLLTKYRAKAPGEDPAKPSYAALTEGVDQSVARLVDHLESTPDPRNGGKPLAENTLVIFTSDNGGEVGWGSFNEPLRGRKGELYDGGLRVPWITWSANPALVAAGRVNSTPINSTDLYPTLASYAGARLPAGVPLDGVDLKRAFSRGTAVQRPLFQHFPGFLSDGSLQDPGSSIREGRWKLLYDYTTRSFELYDLRRDLGETTNLAARRPLLVQRLGTELIDWLEETDAPLATLRANQAPIVLEDFTGRTYVDGVARTHRRQDVRIEPGREVPFVLPSPWARLLGVRR